MKRWLLNYEMQSLFSEPVTNHFFTLRCFPRKTQTQEVLKQDYVVFPCSDSGRGRDSFGNELLTGRNAAGCTQFLVQVSAEVNVCGLLEPDPRPGYQLGIYRAGTERTRAKGALGTFCEGLTRRTEDDWTFAEQVMDEIFRRFTYRPGTTHFGTTAEEAWRQGCGVCQDYAHILLAVCRHFGLTARYVAGAVPGEGQSHAWAEVWKDGLWKGFDPTHNRVTDETYLSFSVGRDAQDCALNRGIFLGNARQRQKIRIRMLEDPSRARGNSVSVQSYYS